MPRGPKVGHKGTLRDRLLARLVIDAATGCWVFTGARQKRSGYGLIGVATAKCALAHRVAYELFVGPIPPDKELHHVCANRPCCNPAHLQAVTRWVHQHIEPTSCAGRTHCKRGHRLAGGNLTATAKARGVRQCRECQNAKNRESYHRRMQTARKSL